MRQPAGPNPQLKALLRENTELTRAVKKNTDLLEEIYRHMSG